MNRMTLLGRAGEDCKLKYTPGNNTPVLEFSVADNRRQGETFVTNWFKVVVYGAMAEEFATLIIKGCEVWCEGTYERRQWTDRGNVKKVVEELHATWLRITTKPYAPGQNPANAGVPL